MNIMYVQVSALHELHCNSCKSTRSARMFTIHTSLPNLPFCGSSTLFAVPSPAQRHERQAPPVTPTPSHNGGGAAVSLAGIILGTCFAVTLIGLAILLALYVVFRYRQRRTETLEPWPEAKWYATSKLLYTALPIVYMLLT